MARLPDDEINKLKRDISLQRLVESSGITLKKHGKDYHGHCPFHDDKTPSLVISPDKNLWHCLGACQTGGDVISWVMKSQGMSFRHAVALLHDGDFSHLAASPVAGALPPGAPAYRPSLGIKRSTTQKLPSLLDASVEDQTLLMQVMDYYHQTLKQNTQALDYLQKRGLNHPELIDHFKLGVANRSLAYRLPEKNRKAGAEIRTRLQTLGILRDSGHEHLNGSLVIPVINNNQILEVYGRKLKNNLRKGTAYHLYLPGPHQGVFNLEAIENSEEVILCESLIDALTFWSAGYRNVTASYGIEGFTDQHLSAFKQHQTKRVLIAYDRDAAGDKAALFLAAKLMKAGIDCYRIQFPKGMDANEFALQVQPANKSLGVAIRSAIWLGKGKAPERPATLEPAFEVKEQPIPQNTTESAERPSIPPEPKPLPASVMSMDGRYANAPGVSASVMPATPQTIEAKITEQEVIITLGDRRYRIRGLSKNLSINQLKVNVLVSKGELLHVDTFDLYAAKSRGLFIKQVALELNIEHSIIKTDLGKILLKLEALQEQQIEQTLNTESTPTQLNTAEKAQALDLLKSPNLIQRIQDDFDRCGIIGEQTNKLMGYLACVSRKLDKPLAVIIQSTSAAGKSALMDAILNLMPEQERVHYSAMTGQSLFYMGETNLKHKILAIAEEEGASNASYALKLLQSEGELTIASTGKDENSGELVTKEYRVEGPVMLFLTTTAIDIDEELMNRCLVLTVNESRAQTKAIHTMQRQQQTLQGLLQSEDKKQLTQLHRNAQQLIQPYLVANPFAEQLTFIDDKTRTRRDHLKYLTLINSIALLHQYQREIKTIDHNGQILEYIEVTPTDIKIANQLAHEVLGRSLNELPPQTLTLLKHIQQMVKTKGKQQSIEQADYRFSRKDIREYSGFGNTQLKVHLGRLEDLEYLLIHQGSRGKSLVYELLYDGEVDDKKHLMGLIDSGNLNYDENKSGDNDQLSGSSRPQVAPKSAGSRGEQNNRKANGVMALRGNKSKTPEKGYIERKTKDASCRSHSPNLAAEG
ncbi:MAG: toprim domain-containing protein [Gammaproteobacteria bacterium]|nr:toprim domain-containing protein [Gammaproteobacteria bacterium]